jgi:hypothetical protein
MEIIGITGRARSGKDTIGAWFRDHRDAFVVSFAWPIRAAIERAFSLPPEIWNGPEKEQDLPWLGKSPRYLAQTLGTEWGRNLVGPDVWIAALEQRLRETRVWYQDCLVVVTDVRFENEATWVRKHGHLLHVSRPGADGKVGVEGHVSEAGVKPAALDAHLLNDGTIAELHERLEWMFPPRGRA